MKLVICKTNLKISFILLLFVSMEVLTFSNKGTEMSRLKVITYSFYSLNFKASE